MKPKRGSSRDCAIREETYNCKVTRRDDGKIVDMWCKSQPSMGWLDVLRGVGVALGVVTAAVGAWRALRAAAS